MKYFYTLIVFFSIATTFAQSYPPTKGTSERISLEADRIADAYDDELAMTAEQKALMKLQVERYLKLREEVMANRKGRAQLNALTNLQAKETLAMNDILERQQMLLYKKIKPEIQPLKMVEVPIKNQEKSKTD